MSKAVDIRLMTPPNTLHTVVLLAIFGLHDTG